MKKIYACLVGKWICLNDEDDCVIGTNMSSPETWLKELDQPVHTLEYVNLHCKGRDYKISPIHLQIVTE